MNSSNDQGMIHIKSIRLWSHVGVLKEERILGQYFNLDVYLWFNVSDAAKNDDLSLTVDYSLAIKGLQEISFKVQCLTIESFSEQILDYLEALYGQIPMKILLEKCNPPVLGFTGSVAIERIRNRL
tara:strand:+ start:135 stop:512 length:378 start_codon:yes stop_codon:yes gene_type:complete